VVAFGSNSRRVIGSLREQTPDLIVAFILVSIMAGVVSREGMWLGLGGIEQDD